MKNINMVLSFLLEVVLLIAFGYWGFHLESSSLVHWLAGLGAPIAVAIMWGTVAAPKAAKHLSKWPLLIFKVCIFTLGSVALFTSHQGRDAIILEAIIAINLALEFTLD